jgi:SAM-dependent methyltransferase
MLGDYLYLGNLFEHEEQFKNPRFIGVAVNPNHSREIHHNLLDPFPFADDLFSKIQSQDVFEHLPKECVIEVMNEVFRILKPNGVFRLSVPDYRHPLLKARSIFSSTGVVIGDSMMGASVHYDKTSGHASTIIDTSYDSHLWFPDYETIVQLILNSTCRFSRQIRFYQHFFSDGSFKVDDIPDLEMPVSRSFPKDPRSNGQPISIVVDFVK